MNCKKNQRFPLVSFDFLEKYLSADEKTLLQKILSVDPKEYGKNHTRFYGLKNIPKNLVALKEQKYFSLKDKKIKTVNTQFLPRPGYAAFIKMKKAMQTEIGKTINVVSGYRSPAYQAAILFINLINFKWSVRKTLKRLTLPGCSEHGNTDKQAMDILPASGVNKLEDFSKTDEYRWLVKNAKRFGFALSYPKNNKFGIIFEPWHWRFEKLKK
ncbi:MAG: M15 family metallopeptidase [Parcubacteria group bacterium]